MGIIDRLSEIVFPDGEPAVARELSENVSRYGYGFDPEGQNAASATPDDAELGDPGDDTWSYLYKDIIDRNSHVDIAVYDDMRRGNGTCRAMLKILQLPILATERSIIPGSADKSGEVAAFAQEWMTASEFDGGMETPIQGVIQELMSAFWAGFKPMEIVWHESGGKIVPRRIVPRSPMSTRAVVDDHGHLLGAYQESLYKGNSRNVFIPLYKLLWHTYGMENMNWYGSSAFEGAYVHYETLRKLYIIDNKAHEVNAIPVRVAKPVQGSSLTAPNRRKVFNMIKRIGLDTAVLLPSGIDLDPFQGNSSHSVSRKESMDHHTAQMAMSILAHFLQLGTSESGGYNLSSDQRDLFLMMIAAEMDSLAADINRYVIAPMVRLNFGNKPGIMPRLVFSDVSDHVRKTTEDVFLALAQQGNRLSDEFMEAIGQRVADELGLDLSISDRLEENVPRTTDKKEEIEGVQQSGVPMQPQTRDAEKVREKVSLSAGEIAKLTSGARNPMDLFNQTKLAVSNKAGIGAPPNPKYTGRIIAGAESDDEIVEFATEVVVDEIVYNVARKEGEE